MKLITACFTKESYTSDSMNRMNVVPINDIEDFYQNILYRLACTYTQVKFLQRGLIFCQCIYIKKVQKSSRSNQNV